ncbi:hypothetical protein CK204_27485, partial [Klebsiella pneumoniae]
NTARHMAVPVGARLWQPKGCPECNFIGYRGRTGQPWQADANTARHMAVPVGARLWQPKGCPECNFIGYRGRTG